MRRLLDYEREKRFARAMRVVDVPTSFTKRVREDEKPALPESVHWPRRMESRG